MYQETIVVVSLGSAACLFHHLWFLYCTDCFVVIKVT